MTDYQDWQEPQAHATAISVTGVPLLSLPSNLVNDQSRNLAASGIWGYSPVTLAQLSYVATVQVNIPSSATIPYLHVNLLWSDSATSQITGEDNYYCAGAPANPGFTTLGSGPAKGNICTVTITNLDPAQAMQVNFMLSQDSMVRTKPLWHWQNSYDSGLTIPALTNAALPVDENCLGNWTSSTIAASSTADKVFGMAPGRWAQLSLSCSGITSTSIAIRALPVVKTVYTTDSHLLDEVLPALRVSYNFIAPRCPVQVEISNNATTGTLTVSGGLYYLD